MNSKMFRQRRTVGESFFASPTSVSAQQRSTKYNLKKENTMKEKFLHGKDKRHQKSMKTKIGLAFAVYKRKKAKTLSCLNATQIKKSDRDRNEKKNVVPIWPFSAMSAHMRGYTWTLRKSAIANWTSKWFLSRLCVFFREEKNVEIRIKKKPVFLDKNCSTKNYNWLLLTCVRTCAVKLAACEKLLLQSGQLKQNRRKSTIYLGKLTFISYRSFANDLSIIRKQAQNKTKEISCVSLPIGSFSGMGA